MRDLLFARLLWETKYSGPESGDTRSMLRYSYVLPLAKHLTNVIMRI